jgi:hypothetical protein
LEPQISVLKCGIPSKAGSTELFEQQAWLPLQEWSRWAAKSRKLGPLTFATSGEIIILSGGIVDVPADSDAFLPFLRIHSSLIGSCLLRIPKSCGGAIMPLVAASKKLIKFDPKVFLSTIDGGRKIAVFSKKQTIFVQGDSSDAVFYIQKGKVRLSVVSKPGKEATIGILNEGDFFGEGCLAGHPIRGGFG